jgi:hypothetical protein
MRGAAILLHKIGENCLHLDLDWIISSINSNLVSFLQRLLIVPPEPGYGSKGVAIKALKAEHADRVCSGKST